MGESEQLGMRNRQNKTANTGTIDQGSTDRNKTKMIGDTQLDNYNTGRIERAKGNHQNRTNIT